MAAAAGDAGDVWTARFQYSEFIPSRMYQMMHARGIPRAFIQGYTQSWLSMGDGTIVLHHDLAKFLFSRQLLDLAMVQQCRQKGCFESVSGLYGMYAALQYDCDRMHVHFSTHKTHGGNVRRRTL